MGLLDKAADIKTSFTGPADKGPGLEDRGADGGSPLSPEGLPEELKSAITKYCDTYTSVHGIVISDPPNYDAKEAGESFDHQLNRVVAAFGTAIPLSSRRNLVLFSNTIDRELLAHRLSKSLEGEIFVVFQSDTTASVVDYIRPYL
ncbi:MAG: hypothetical protein LBH51_10005 [Treponema sp.]|jgi:hypothetical protein|nr:hypothetical protein [Treponema sp.]